MKNMIKFGALALCMAAAPVFSQAARVGLNLSAMGQLPVGSLADNTGIGIGGLGGIEVGTYPGLALTARSGYIYHFREDDRVLTQVPIMGGAKFTIPGGPVYLAGELGAVILHSDDSNPPPFTDGTQSSTNFAWSAGIGSAVGATDIRLSFNVLDANNMSNTMTMGLTLGFNIWSM